MDLSSQKRIAADVLKCGITRVRITADGEAMKEVEEALTREDIRALVRKGLIKKIQMGIPGFRGYRKKEDLRIADSPITMAPANIDFRMPHRSMMTPAVTARAI